MVCILYHHLRIQVELVFTTFDGDYRGRNMSVVSFSNCAVKCHPLSYIEAVFELLSFKGRNGRQNSQGMRAASA
jgi:hypothetical protein